MADRGGVHGSANLLKVDEDGLCSGRCNREGWFWSERGSVALCFVRLVCVSELRDGLPQRQPANEA
jgi:hypothetical protein